MAQFSDVFKQKKNIFGCIHLRALPGSPNFDGDLRKTLSQALEEAETYEKNGCDAIVLENFHDSPFYPDTVPAETIAAMTAVAKEVVSRTKIPLGINVLRNDARAALAIATAVEAHFIRVNVHLGAVVADQGIIEGKAHLTLRLKAQLKSKALIFADVGVKHAAPLVKRGLHLEAQDLQERGAVDALIVSGDLTGHATNPEDLKIVKAAVHIPVFIGSGTTLENLENYRAADGFIVGSYFKKDGKVSNAVDPNRVQKMSRKLFDLIDAKKPA